MAKDPKILVDARMVQARGHGIGNYVADIAKGYSRAKKNQELPYTLEFLLGPDSPTDGVWQDVAVVRSRYKFLSVGEIFGLSKEILANGCDFYHSPSFASLLKYPCSYIQTAHDLNHLYYGSLSQKVYYRFLLKSSLRNASQIVTVSETSRGEIREWLGNSSGEIKVVPNAFSLPAIEIESESNFEQLGLIRNEYFVCLATEKRHKRLKFMLEIYNEARSRVERPWPLLLTIDPNEIDFVLPEGVKILPSSMQKNIWSLIANAGALCFPSEYEGFGRPPLEALAVGTPVISADIPVMRETLAFPPSEAIRMIGLDSQEEWVEVLQRTQENPKLLVPTSFRELVLDKWSIENMWEKQSQIYSSMVDQ